MSDSDNQQSPSIKNFFEKLLIDFFKVNYRAVKKIPKKLLILIVGSVMLFIFIGFSLAVYGFVKYHSLIDNYSDLFKKLPEICKNFDEIVKEQKNYNSELSELKNRVIILEFLAKNMKKAVEDEVNSQIKKSSKKMFK